MSRRTAWAIGAFWLLVGFAYMMSFYVDSIRFDTKFRLSIGMFVLFESVYVCWAGLTFGLYRLLRGPIIRSDLLRITAIFFVVMLIWQPFIAIIDTTITTLVFGQPLSTVFTQVLAIRSTTVFFNAVLYVVVFLTCAGLIFQRHSEETKLSALELERKNTETELSLTNMRFRALQNQLSPHFLFNSLNAISGLARQERGDDIVAAVARLGDLLRYALQASDRSLVTVQEEVDFTRSYVSLQRLRFGDDHTFRLDYNDGLGGYECPPFILQALVENAFTHEVSRREAGVTIDARIERDADRLKITVTNSTEQTEGPTEASLGLALENLGQRLEILYGQQGVLTNGFRDGHYVAAASFPIEVSTL